METMNLHPPLDRPSSTMTRAEVMVPKGANSLRRRSSSTESSKFFTYRFTPWQRKQNLDHFQGQSEWASERKRQIRKSDTEIKAASRRDRKKDRQWDRVTECGLRQLHCSSDLYWKSRTYRLENRKRGKKGGKKKEGKGRKRKKKKKKKKERKKWDGEKR